MIDVTAIKLPEDFKGYKNSSEENADFLEPLSKINILVGANNSGKSRLMRELSLQEGFNIKVEGVDLSFINEKILNFIGIIRDKFDELDIEEVNNLKLYDLNRLANSLSTSLSYSDDEYQVARDILKKWANLQKITFYRKGGNPYPSFEKHVAEELENLIVKEADKALSYVNKIPVYPFESNLEKVYIPALRGLRRLDDDQKDFYLDRTRQDYFIHQVDVAEAMPYRKRPEIFTGLTLFKRIGELIGGSYLERKSFRDYQEYLSANLFEGKKIEIVPSKKEEVVIVKIGDEQEQPIHHLGDGIQSAIILTFLPFVMQEQTFFFIEEPETYLHPGLQRKVLEFYNSLEKHTFFMTTHSNHFLDITIDLKDVSIFTFRKDLKDLDESTDEADAEFTFEAVDSGNQSSLELLGVRNSSVFLVNATVWVEGITDRWYLRKMLESYMKYLEDTDGEVLEKRLEEDTHYSFVEYGGANITHWSFLNEEEHPIGVKNLCGKALVIIDGDGDRKKARKEALMTILGEKNLIILPCQEIENLLPYKTIKEVVAEYERIDSSDLPEIKYDVYKNAYLGQFILDKMLKNESKRKASYVASNSKSGALNDKKTFCAKAKDKIEFIDLPESTKEVVEKIYKFIKDQN